MKAKYKNAIRSKMLIRNALITLLNKKPLSDISVTDIVKFADTNRGTFYNHYSNPLDILEEIKNELMEKLSVVLKNSKNTSSIDDLLDIINSYFLENEKDYKIIVNAIPYSVVEKIKHNFIEEITKIDLNGTSLVTVHFAVNGLVGLYLDYLKDNVPFSYQEVIKSSKEIIHKLFL